MYYVLFFYRSEPVAGLLHVLEQIPGYIRIDDQTKLFVNQTYWPSYNIPFNKDVFNMSGNQQLVKQFGDWFVLHWMNNFSFVLC